MNLVDLREGRVKFSIPGHFPSFSKDGLKIAAQLGVLEERREEKSLGAVVYDAPTGKGIQSLPWGEGKFDLLPDGNLLGRDRKLGVNGEIDCSGSVLDSSQYLVKFEVACSFMAKLADLTDREGRFLLGNMPNEFDYVVSGLEDGRAFTVLNLP